MQQKSKYTVEFTVVANEDTQRHLKNGNLILHRRIKKISESLSINPREGIGNPKILRHTKGVEIWARKIDDKHRLIYTIDDDVVVVIVISAYGHYGDK
jgi:toxin YoeB